MNELDRVEAQALRDAVVAGGGSAAMVGGAVCLAHPRAPIPELNRAIPLGATVDVGAIAAWFDGRDHVVGVPPGYLGLEQSLAAAGYTPAGAWQKFQRNDDPPPSALGDLRVEESLDRAAFAVASGEGSGIPEPVAAELSALVGGPGWYCFVAWDGDEPAACGALYADGDYGWLGIGATRPAFRRRGAQSTLLAARIARARELGVKRLATETGADGGTSYRNIERAGFRPAYLRPNWRTG